MRHLIVLPGNSLKNKAWGELMCEAFAKHFDSSFMLSYDHWATGEANLNFEQEVEKIREHVELLPAGTEIVVFAKSAGALLAFLAVHKGVISPVRSVFFGIPFDLAANGLFKDAWEPVDSFKVPALAFHNVEDSTTSYEFTKATLATHAPHITFITTNEADHWYGDIATYETFIGDK